MNARARWKVEWSRARRARKAGRIDALPGISATAAAIMDPKVHGFPTPAQRHAGYLLQAAHCRGALMHWNALELDTESLVRHAHEYLGLARSVLEEAVTCPACHAEQWRRDCYVKRSYVWVGNPVGPGGNQHEVDREWIICGNCGHEEEHPGRFGLTSLQGMVCCDEA